MMNRLLSLQNVLAKTIAAIAIVVFWCFSTVGTTIGTTVGLTSLATAINAATSTPAEAGRRYRRRGRRWRGRGYRRRGYYGYGGYPYRRRGGLGIWFGF